MSLLCSNTHQLKRLKKPRDPPVVDLQEIIENAAWRSLKIPFLCGCKTNPCKKQGLYLKIDWSYISTQDTVESFVVVPGVSDVVREVQLYRTQFRNFTGASQNFAFNAERQTTSTVEMSVQEGVTIGGNVNLNFSLAKSGVDDNVPLSGTVGGQVSWNKTVNEKYSKAETMKWGVNSTFTLQDGERALGCLSVQERELTGKIRIRTDVKITHPHHLLPVDVVSKKDNKVVTTIDLAANSICKDQSSLNQYDKESPAFTYFTNVTCHTVYGIEQIAAVRRLKEGEEEHFMGIPSAYESKEKNVSPARCLGASSPDDTS